MERNNEAKEESVGMTSPRSRFSEWFSEVISKAELADIRHNVKGFLVHRPWSVLLMENMYAFYEGEMKRTGHMPVWFPALIPESNFKKEAEHVEGFIPEVFWVTHSGDRKLEERLAMRPTSETAMYSMYSIWVRSWRDLPLKLYQKCQVWRYETKATRPFIRGREFYWIEAHDVFATLGEAEKQVREDMTITESVMHRVFGIPFIFIKRPDWDKFPGAVYTFAADSLMPDGRIIQQPSTHLLGQNFSRPFGISFVDRDNREKYGWQTCHGPAIWRMVASVISLHGDDKGLRFPFEIAPLQVIIVPIGHHENKPVLRYCGNVRKSLLESGLTAEVDSRDYTPGWKFNHWEMKGVPIRLEIGPREMSARKVTLVRRDTGGKKKVPVKDIAASVQKQGKLLSLSLRREADAYFRKNIREARSMEELRRALARGGFVRIGFCSTGIEGLPCAEKIKESLKADVRGERADRKEPARGRKCVVCGRPAKHVVYVGKQY
jgi:prolyl-tRNA synthetase